MLLTFGVSLEILSGFSVNAGGSSSYNSTGGFLGCK